VARAAAGSGLDIEARIDLADTSGRATTRLTGEIEGTLYRLVQEALTNAIKHAGAERVWIDIIEDDDVVTVAVSDDGGGFDPGGTSGGFGLVGMRERVELVAGQLLVDSAHGKGTVVRAQLPALHETESSLHAEVGGA
jgi:two-component system, NarL family, sensor histidine kinase DevS